MSAALELQPTPVSLAHLHTRLEQDAGPSAAERFDWLIQLRQDLPASAKEMDIADAKIRMRLAIACDDWPMITWLGTVLSIGNTATVEDELYLGIALWRIGRPSQAQDISRRLLLIQPHNPHAQALHQQLLDEQHKQTHFPPWDPAQAQDSVLRLEPLSHQHVADFAWQYYDPSIADLCCLPHFNNDEEWHTWLDEMACFDDQMMFAIWHHDWGFIGSVSLILQDGIGFFYYWVGRDFQGHGFAPRAAALLFELAETQWGMTACYAKVFADNMVSRRGLTKLGFKPVNFTIESHQKDEIHLRRARLDQEHMCIDTMAEEAREGFYRMNLHSTVLRPLRLPSKGG